MHAAGGGCHLFDKTLPATCWAPIPFFTTSIFLSLPINAPFTSHFQSICYFALLLILSFLCFCFFTGRQLQHYCGTRKMILGSSLKRCFCENLRHSGLWNLLLKSKNCISSNGLVREQLNLVIKKATFSLLMLIFAFGGAIIGSIAGAIKGQTTEIGMFRGAGVGVVAGAVTAVQLMESTVNGEPVSKVALILSLVDGKIFMEWVSPAVLKAYQSQISTTERNIVGEVSDIFDVYNASKGLSYATIKKLPQSDFQSMITNLDNISLHKSCAICLQDFKNRDSLRTLPRCRHFFHTGCVDEWLSRQGNCPICRRDV